MKLWVLGRTSYWVSFITKVMMTCTDNHFLSMIIMQDSSSNFFFLFFWSEQEPLSHYLSGSNEEDYFLIR